MNIKIIYEDNDLLVADKPAGIIVFPESTRPGLVEKSTRQSTRPGLVEKTLIDLLIEKYPDLKNTGEAPRYGVVHRLDKDTSGILLVARNNEALIFFQKQFISRGVEKRYTALATGVIKDDSGKIETLISRSPANPSKQKVYLLDDPKAANKRQAITEYKILQRFKDYTLLEVSIKTGRKHQIRCHLAYIHHPVAGDKLYGFKDSSAPEGLTRQFLHASYIKIKMPNRETREFRSELPRELIQIVKNLNLKIQSDS